MGKGSYQGGSSIDHAGIGYEGSQSRNLSPKPIVGPTRRRLEQRAKVAEDQVRRVEAKIIKLKSDLEQLKSELRGAEKVRQDIDRQIKKKMQKR